MEVFLVEVDRLEFLAVVDCLVEVFRVRLAVVDRLGEVFLVEMLRVVLDRLVEVLLAASDRFAVVSVVVEDRSVVVEDHIVVVFVVLGILQELRWRLR